MTVYEPFDTLFVLGRGPELFENVTIHLKLATLESVKRGKKVEVVLMHDAVWWAQKDGKGKELYAAPPEDDVTLEQRVEKLLSCGVIVNACKPCLTFRKIPFESLHPEVKIIEGPDFLEKKDVANRVLMFM